jgi:hypothetical protein
MIQASATGQEVQGDVEHNAIVSEGFRVFSAFCQIGLRLIKA